ncbi:cobyrinate a,c-diamide synthase [Oryzihumus leptocrescens]|uniref:Hydrogenobyrinate a,c-diamide synthase n=1 Tax=Oryzihumus leptocrescens TaxID=297536 RepID=A0A542ZIK8_9MICO|nr:cobyrinate a,c-diamide synthase [Oryzihumus leptocrescens]TQL60181.1 cobyrinic acid a,c-diamide synthase [Oryzihumus leptocrescens]
MSAPLTHLPRIVVAAPASGHGKTMVATGLMAALRAAGHEVSPHKVGPDYIDPGYHELAARRPGRNLDPHLQGEDLIVPLLLHGARRPRPADVAVVEGVMGLFDGATGTGGFSSTAHVARLVQAPVLLVVDARAAGRSLGAVVHGFSRYEDEVRVAGVVLNNVASARHEAEARDGIAATGVPVLGALPRLPDLLVPSRHLGLVPAAERSPEATAAVAALSDLVREHVDLDAVVRLARQAPDLAAVPWDPARAVGAPVTGPRPPRVAVAGGRAFTFGYAETAELLAAAGAEVVGFDPLRDERLPEDVSALVIGGGFPEVHAADLSLNASLRQAISEFASQGGAVAAECAGLLYLAEELDGAPMCGVLPLRARMDSRLTLGYRSAVALTGSVLAAEGERVTGHEFHRTVVVPSTTSAPAPAWGWRGTTGEPVREGAVRGRVHASYLHTHWAGHPQLASRLVTAATEVAR